MSGDASGANLPYAAKYLKDSNTKCSKCFKSPAQEELLLGIRELCPSAGLYIDRWYHVACFFPAMRAKRLPVTEAAIRGMSWLKWHDQETVRAHIEAFDEQHSPSSSRQFLSSCRAEHAKSGRGKCGSCKANIAEDEAKYFCKGAHHHLNCFMRGDIVFVGAIDSIQGYASLKKEAQDALKQAFETHKLGKKVKAEKKADAAAGPMDAAAGDAGASSSSMAKAPSATSSSAAAVKARTEAANSLLEAARKMDRQRKDEIELLALDGTATRTTAAAAAVSAEDDDEIEVVEVVMSDKPPVVTLGLMEAAPPTRQPPLPSQQPAAVIVEESRPKSSLNDLFARFQKADSSLSSLMESAPKRARLLEGEEMGREELNKQLKKQADALWTLREAFEGVRDQDIEELMRKNDMFVPTGRELLVMSIADAALFGAPGQCSKCPDGRFIFNTDLNTYTCMGNETEWTKCTNADRNPTRCPLGIPRSLSGRISRVEATGAMHSMPRRYYPVGSDETRVKGLPSMAISAELVGSGSSKNGSQFGGFARPGINAVPAAAAGKQFIKRGTVVDGQCEYASVSHVYRDDDGVLFSCSLTQVDMGTNRNSYFKMQLLQHDMESNVFYLFKSWGRVGTSLGDAETLHHANLEHAKREFVRTFSEKTGNEWADKKYFRKRAGKMAMVDMDYSEIEQDKNGGEVEAGSLTKLEVPVQQLILRIFDQDMFKSALKSFDLDMDQMPLGKLSKRQLERAYGVLNELQTMMQSSPERSAVIDASNRFYSLIPHNFGHKPLVVLDSKEIIEKKSKLIENLMDIAIAVDLMKEDGDRPEVKLGVTAVDPIDAHYIRLKSEITPLPSSHPDYTMIEKYAKHTHGSTHSTKISITDIFKVSREGEEQRFKHDLGNRMLLWHGSRLSNFVGILSQGLRIAPPEAPHAGYMFGKGIYFADMVSKSANYCHPDLSAQDAFLLLCDVALGVIQEENNATSVNPLKNGATAVKGVGYQYPDPGNVHYHPDGFVVPNGKATRGKQRIYLEYNEYIVYDVAQVRIRYLVRTKMNWQ